jgi:hypothetical protein
MPWLGPTVLLAYCPIDWLSICDTWLIGLRPVREFSFMPPGISYMPPSFEHDYSMSEKLITRSLVPKTIPYFSLKYTARNFDSCGSAFTLEIKGSRPFPSVIENT